MATIRKRTWTNKTGKHTCYEISYVVDGKQYKKGGYATLIDAQVDLPNVITDTSRVVRFEVIANDYINRHCVLNCKTSTKDVYKNYIDIHLNKFTRKIAKDIKKRDLENLVLELKNKELSNKMINDIISLVISILNYGVECEYLKVNPIPKFKKLPNIKPPINFLNETQINIFIEQAKLLNPTYYAFFHTAVNTGMRRGELLALQWSDIDFNHNKININKQIYRGVEQSTKTGKSRTIDLDNALKLVLIEHKKNNILLSKYVFCNLKGLPLHPYIIEQDYFKPLLKRCNEILDEENQIKKLRFHDLRHTHATYLLSKGIPVKYVQERLGHSTARMTLDTYASVMPSVKFGALELLENLGNRTQIEHENLKPAL